MRKFLAFFLAAGALLAAEPSAFRAGSISGSESYGLSESEKVIRANRQAIERLEKRVFALEQEVSRLSELADALNGANRAYGEAIAAIRRDQERLLETSKQIGEDEAKNKTRLEAINTRQDTLEKQVNKALADQAKNQEKLAKSIENISKKISAKTSEQESVKDAAQEGAKSGAKDSANKNEFDGAKPETLLTEARSMIDKRDYDNAYARLSYLIGKKYKIPETTFSLGALYYFQEDNPRALAAFKTSANADEKARHMPVLLYYSAICNERMKNTDDAKKFYAKLIEQYPDHNVTDNAKKRLDKLSKI